MSEKCEMLHFPLQRNRANKSVLWCKFIFRFRKMNRNSSLKKLPLLFTNPYLYVYYIYLLNTPKCRCKTTCCYFVICSCLCVNKNNFLFGVNCVFNRPCLITSYGYRFVSVGNLTGYRITVFLYSCFINALSLHPVRQTKGDRHHKLFKQCRANRNIFTIPPFCTLHLQRQGSSK